MTDAELSALLRGLAPVVRDFVLSQQKATHDRLTALETQDLPAGPAGPAGKDGKDGNDAIGPEDVEEDYEDGGRVLVRRWMRNGQVVKELRHTQKSMIYRDTYKFDRDYLYGDVVTWDGGMWMAVADHPKGQPTVSPEWKLVVMRGKVGAKGPQGPQGPMGGKS